MTLKLVVVLSSLLGIKVGEAVQYLDTENDPLGGPGSECSCSGNIHAAIVIQTDAGPGIDLFVFSARPIFPQQECPLPDGNVIQACWNLQGSITGIAKDESPNPDGGTWRHIP